MSDDYGDESSHYKISRKPKIQIYGSSQKPIKTDCDGKLIVKEDVDIDEIKEPVVINGAVSINNTVDINLIKPSLIESGNFFSFCSSYSSSAGGTVFYQISNPKNSGKTIKIWEIWAIDPNAAQAGLSTGFLDFFKNSYFGPPLQEITGGYNLNYAFSDDHVAKFYCSEDTLAAHEISHFLTGSIRLHQKKFFFNGNIVMPSSTTQDQRLLIEFFTGTGVNNTNITIIWSEE